MSQSPRPLIAILAITALLGSAAPADAQKSGAIATHGDWSAFRDGPDDKPVCYMGSVPKKEEGTYSRRGDTYILVTHRSAEKTYDVISISAGYEYQSGSQVEVEIDGQDFSLFTDGDHGWAEDAKADKALVAAMRRGSRMIVRGTSKRGTLTTDTYVLSGFTAAHKAINKACGRK